MFHSSLLVRLRLI